MESREDLAKELAAARNRRAELERQLASRTGEERVRRIEHVRAT